MQESTQCQHVALDQVLVGFVQHTTLLFLKVLEYDIDIEDVLVGSFPNGTYLVLQVGVTVVSPIIAGSGRAAGLVTLSHKVDGAEGEVGSIEG